MREITLTIPIEIAYDERSLKRVLAREAGIAEGDWVGYHLLKRSVDARHRPIKGRVVAKVYDAQEEWTSACPRALPAHALSERETRGEAESSRRVLIVGAGPAGLFAALRALSMGIKPIIIERGKRVRERRRDLAILNQKGEVNPESNYCFGEGGAGTYSDGKLYTRAKKRGAVKVILRLLADHGAPKEVCYEAHPHIGTNRLPKVIESIRETILNQGGEIHFNKRVDALLFNSKAGDRSVSGVRLSDGGEFLGGGVILATGHSARGVFEMLHRQQVRIEAKPFALGVRAEHPQEMVDRIQYHGDRPPLLGSAAYRLVTQVEGRGVFSFCMCPGGIIAPASTATHEIVVNGWSPYKRNGKYANSGVVVSVDERDFEPFVHEHGPLAGLAFQRQVERAAYLASGGAVDAKPHLIAPAQRLIDFVNGRPSDSLPACSYVPGVSSAPIAEILPPSVTRSLQVGFSHFGQKMRGYLSREAIVVGVESRTSSPVRVPRSPKTLQHPEVERLYPCGEGAGYAGGIVSAALDGFKCAEAACAQLSATEVTGSEDDAWRHWF
jgi:uncharacterized protein